MAETKREHDRVFQMRVSDAFLATVDGWRRSQPDLPSRAEAVRRLVEQATAIPPEDLEALLKIRHRENSEGANS